MSTQQSTDEQKKAVIVFEPDYRQLLLRAFVYSLILLLALASPFLGFPYGFSVFATLVFVIEMILFSGSEWFTYKPIYPQDWLPWAKARYRVPKRDLAPYIVLYAFALVDLIPSDPTIRSVIALLSVIIFCGLSCYSIPTLVTRLEYKDYYWLYLDPLEISPETRFRFYDDAITQYDSHTLLVSKEHGSIVSCTEGSKTFLEIQGRLLKYRYSNGKLTIQGERDEII